MTYKKRTPVEAAGFLILFALMFFCICGCAKNEAEFKSSYDDILNEAAYGQRETVPELMPATISFGQKNDEKSMEPATTEIAAAAAPIPETAETAAIEEASKEAEELFVITQSGKKYHLQSCYMVKSIKQYFTKEEAEQSKYEPCKICNPH